METWGLHVGRKWMNWEILKGLTWGCILNKFEWLPVGTKGQFGGF